MMLGLPPISSLAEFLLFVYTVQSAHGLGFCLNEVPDSLTDTGYTALSSLNETQCSSGGYEWCPLNDTLRSAPSPDLGYDYYYYYSICCTGVRGNSVIPDPTGIPTCKPGKSYLLCTRFEWQTKVMEDVLGDDSGYDPRVTPSSALLGSASSCNCDPDEPSCEMRSEDGTKCLICLTDAACSVFQVQMGLNFFKLVELDLETSRLVFDVWLRHEWNDVRLAYYPQCYGGLSSFDVQGHSGQLENTLIWTPDIELYNAEEPIWDGSFGARLALVYPCSDDTPTPSDCGYIFWSRPGLLHALCSYEGLALFPYDVLSCMTEFAGWGSDGKAQDIIPRKADGGVAWIDKPGFTPIVGLTAGSSFQNFIISDIWVNRKVVYYDCCPSNFDVPIISMFRNWFCRASC